MTLKEMLPPLPTMGRAPPIPMPKEVVTKVTNDAADFVSDAESAIKQGPLTFVEKGLRKIGSILP